MTNTYNSQFEITITSNPIFDIELSNGGKGDKGEDGINGVGVIQGGLTNQILVKNSDADYDMKWVTASVVTPVDSVNGQIGDVVLDYEDVGASPVGHTHDDRYYTETEVNNLLTPKMNLTGDNSNVDILTFDLTPSSTTLTEGQMRWNNTDGTLDLQHANATQQIGQELFIKVINKSGASIPNASAVYFNGRQGNRPKIELARADSQATSVVMGITTQDIADDAEGFITSFGYVRQIKTDYVGWTEGATLYVSSTVAGELTITEPSAPSHSDIVGSVGIVGGNGIGSILVKIERHKDLTDLSDVNGTPLTTEGQIPVWNEPEKVFDFNYNITNYVEKITGKGLSTEDYTTSEKSKLAGIEALAEVNNISDINATDLTDLGNTDLHTHKLIVNEVSVDNAKVEALATGVKITHNVANTNAALTVNSQLGTDNIMVWQKGGVKKANLDIEGAMFATKFHGDLVNLIATNNARIYMNSTGAKIERNIADANHALIVNQANASSTGKILDLQFGGASKSNFDKDGNISCSGSIYTGAGGLFRTPNGIANDTSQNYSKLDVASTGLVATRNVADANSALKINQAHASSTGLITDFQFGGVSKASVDKDGIIKIGTKTPASATAVGVAGQVAWDADYIYVCVATNTWKRVAIATW